MTKKELREDIAILEQERKKASRKALMAEAPFLRKDWERLALALRHAVEALTREETR